MRAAGAGEIVIADTIGAATPTDLSRLLDVLLPQLPVEILGMHLHDTRGMALADAWCGLAPGVRRFDAQHRRPRRLPVCTRCSGKPGNLDLALMAQQCELETGIDLDALCKVIEIASRIVGYQAGGHSQAWLARRGRVQDGLR